MAILRGATALANLQACTFITSFPASPTAGTFYLVGGWVLEQQLKGYENEVLLYNGTDYLTQIRDEANKIIVSGETYSYYPASGWLKTQALINNLDGGSGGTSTGGGGLTQAEAQAAFTAALQSESQVEFQDILLEDANGTLYIATRTIDEEAGSVTFTNRLPDGSAHTPVGASIAPRPRSAATETLFFRVMVSNGVNTSVGDYLTKDVTFNPDGTVASTRWFNVTTNTAITGTFPNQVDLKLWNRLIDDAVNGTRTAVDNVNINTSFLASRVDYRKEFWANIAGSGYSVGDRLERVTFSNGGIIWRNRTTEAAIAAPTITNLVPTIDQCFISGTITTTAHTADLPASAAAGFTDSAIITIPLIDGKKANVLYLVRTAQVNSPLFPNDSGILHGIQSTSLFRTPLSQGSVNRPNQANISNVGGFTRLNRELDGVVIRNYNLGTSTHTYRFSYQAENADNPEIDNSLDAAYRLITFQNNLTTTSDLLTVQVDIKSIVLQIFCNGATTPVTFTLEQTISLGGIGRQFPVQSLTFPTGSTSNQFQIPYSTRTGQFRILTSGTFANYSYRLIFN